MGHLQKVYKPLATQYLNYSYKILHVCLVEPFYDYQNIPNNTTAFSQFLK